MSACLGEMQNLIFYHLRIYRAIGGAAIDSSSFSRMALVH